MPTPNKYAADGTFYTPSELERRKVAATPRYLILGYINPRRSFQWYGEHRIRPFNRNINKAARQARAAGLRFSKQDFWN